MVDEPLDALRDLLAGRRPHGRWTAEDYLAQLEEEIADARSRQSERQAAISMLKDAKGEIVEIHRALVKIVAGVKEVEKSILEDSGDVAGVLDAIASDISSIGEDVTSALDLVAEAHTRLVG